jgi:uncharacterized protein with HEPN domain
MSRRDQIPLTQMLGYAREAVKLASGKSRGNLDTDRLFELALTRLLEVIGEAANRIPDEIQAVNPEIPWLQVIGLRNRLIHGYDSVDFDILWAIVKDDLPDLIRKLEKILK